VPALHAQGPGFDPQHDEKEERKRKKIKLPNKVFPIKIEILVLCNMLIFT
jgi:hypothetical protein